MPTDNPICWPDPGSAGLVWLGQAGFWIETGQHRILIDPYLSDSLAVKYKGTKNDHMRMVLAPCSVTDVPRPDIVLISHAHTDHMDPDTLGPLCRRFPNLPFVVPTSKLKEARSRIGQTADLIGVDADECITPVDGLTLTVFPAAHEELIRDDDGHHAFLGFGIDSAGLKILHPGDTIPYPGLTERVRKFAPDIALFPVNGRDKERLAQGIPGNLTLAEALELACEVPVIIPHHWGMFSFNTIDPAQIQSAANQCTTSQIWLPECGQLVLVDNAGTCEAVRISARTRDNISGPRHRVT